MATEKTDVVIVGVGAAGGILAAELGKAGMKVIGIERGPRLATKDFAPQDELRYFQRQDLRPDRSEEHTSELQSRGHLVCRLLLEKKKNNTPKHLKSAPFDRQNQRP